MRLLVLSNVYPPVIRGGYEIECHDIVTHLRERHEVTVLASDHGAAGLEPDPHVLRTLPWTGRLGRVDALRAPWTARRGVAAVRRSLAAVDPEAILIWNAAAVPASAVWALQHSGLPLLARVSEYWLTYLYTSDQFTKWLRGPQPNAVRRSWASAMRLADRLLGLGVEWEPARPVAVAWCSDFIRSQSLSSPGFEVVHEDVMFPVTESVARLRHLPRAPVAGRILFVGRLDDEKGAQVLVRAIAILRDRHRIDATLHVIGSGTPSEQAAIAALIGRLGLGGQVVLRGHLQGAGLESEIAAASAWAVPSVWQEPAGTVTLEAAAARVPAVVSLVGGLPELLLPERHALFHEAGDADGCAAALAVTLAGGDEVDARVQRAYERTNEQTFARLLESYDRFLEEGLAALRAT